MPGLVGLITRRPAGWARSQLAQMMSVVHHEDFYQLGTWEDETLGIYVGWAMRNDSSSLRLPLVNERGDVVLLFSGEDFPDPSLLANLKRRGHQFERAPHHLVHLYEDDESFPASVNGRFQGLAVDRRTMTAALFNDRWGLHRLYYRETKDTFYFAAEAKAILTVQPEARALDSRSFGEFVACGCVLENRSLFRGLEVLPPASRWTFRSGALAARGAYFHPSEWEQQEPLQPEPYYRQLRDVVAANFPRYFEATDRIGISLTGGLDSRLVLAWTHPQAGSVPAYSFGSTYRDCQDVRVARWIAAATRQSHQVITVGREFLGQFPRYAERTVYLSDGCNEVNRAADLYANERVREIAPVRMTGNYGGEVLRHVRAFKPSTPEADVYVPEIVASAREAHATYTEIAACPPTSFAVFRQAPWHHFGLLALEETQVSLRTPYLDNDLVRTAFRAPRGGATDVCERLIGDGDPNLALQTLATDRGVGKDGLAGKVSRALLQFTFKAEYAYDYGMPNAIATVDSLFRPLHLERLFLGRHKFAHYRIWYRDFLAGYVKEMLLDRRSLGRPYVKPTAVERMVLGHCRGRENHTTSIHKLLTLELVHRLFIDS